MALRPRRWIGQSPTGGKDAMISLPSAVRIYLCTRAVDLRKSFDGLSGLVHECFGQDPLSGHLFLFLNRRRDRIKLLYFDRDGLAIWYKRLEAGSFQMPQATQDGIELQPAQLAMLLSGIDLRTARQRKRFQLAG
jgi:transposase